MRDLLETIEEFSYNDIVLEASKDKEIDAIVATLGSKPNLDEIYGKLGEVYKIKGFAITKSFLRGQYLGKVAVKYGLPGLYPPDKGNMISTKTDDVGRFQVGGNMKTNIELAKMGLLPPFRLEKLEKIADGATKTAERGDNPDRAKVALLAADALKAAGNDQKAKEIEDRIVASPTGKKNPEMVAKINAEKRTADKDDSGEDDAKGAAQDASPSASGMKITNDNVAKLIAKYNDMIVKGKAKSESSTKSHADQLLYLLVEALTDAETDELQNMVLAFGQAVKDDSIDQAYRTELQRILDKWEQDKKDIGLFAGDDAKGATQDDATVDYASDEQVKKAVADVEAWISTEMPKELEKAQAKGLMKATNSGKIKSASAAAVQTILMRIGTANNNEELKKIKADGLYGPATIAGVKRAQELAGITVDGDAGANTAKELLAYSKDPQKGIDDSIEKDFARIKELIAKSKGGDPSTNMPMVTSVDFRHLMSIVEGQINEALSPEEYKELRGLLDKHKARMDDGDSGQLYSQELRDIYKNADAIKDPAAGDAAGDEKGAAQSLDDVKNHQDLAKALNDAMKGGFFFGLGTDEQAVLAALGKVKDANSFKKLQATYKQMYKATLQQHIEEEFSGGDLEQVMGVVNKLGGFEGAKPTDAGTDDAKGAAQGPAEPIAKKPPTQQQLDKRANTMAFQSKDYSMKNPINEASMNISMNGESAAEVAQLVDILKNAGMQQEIPTTISMPTNSHDDMVSHMQSVDGPADSPCGMGEETVDEDEWDNAPDEEYKDHQYMTKELSGGLNRQKKQFKAAQRGDNAMAVESIKDRLYQALEEKSKGLYANIHAKRERGEKPNPPGHPDRPSKQDWKNAAKTAKNN
tara:strand:- start:13210 stop:15810 length:2601 start_codon:yes stop_codon:yes gene_type:complete